MLDCGLKIHSRCPGPEEWRQPGPRVEQQCWKTSEKFPENLNFVQEAERRTSCFPKGVSKGGRVGERVSGWGSGGNNTHPRLQGMARWARAAFFLQASVSPRVKGQVWCPKCLQCWTKLTGWECWSKGRGGMWPSLALYNPPDGEFGFPRRRCPRAGRPCNLNRAGSNGEGVASVYSLKLTSAACRLQSLKQTAPPLPAFPGRWSQ